jgi:alpha-L-rhamnosidase
MDMHTRQVLRCRFLARGGLALALALAPANGSTTGSTASVHEARPEKPLTPTPLPEERGKAPRVSRVQGPIARFATQGASPDELDKRSLRVSHLRCEYLPDPLGVVAPNPQLSWFIESSAQGARQAAYQVLVASTPATLNRDHGDLWDSGKVSSSDSVHLLYRGAALRSRLQCWWKVRVWDAAGHVSEWSAPASWEMGLLRPEDWQAQWIGSGPPREPRPAPGFFTSTNQLSEVKQQVVVDGRSTLLRKTFVLRKPVLRARLYMTGLGYYEPWCNGRRIGPNVLAPAKTNYRRWVLYDIYDLADYLRPGTNALGLMLGNGWFNPYPKWWDPYRMQWFGSKRALARLDLEFTDGSSQVVVSDSSWKTAPGPVLSSCVYDGELYDATQELPGWARPETDDHTWNPAHVVEPPGGQLLPELMPPIQVTRHLPALAMKEPTPGVYVLDFGQNFAGWVRLSLRGPRGARIHLRYAEDVHADGTLDVASNERAEAADTYITKGGGLELYEPRFTFHGFRYVELTGFPGRPALTNVLGCVVHTAAAQTGSFVCGNELLNRIHRATLWSQRSNLMGYPMDCPQRDERLGWFGDAMVSMQEALYNFDLPVFYRQWLNGVRLNQNPANGDISIISPRPYVPDEPDPTWSSAYLVMTWQYYVYYGDRKFLEQQFDAMARYVDFLGTQATNHILPKYWIGDWGTTVRGWKEGEPGSVATAFYYYDARLVAKAARVLGRIADAEKYEALAHDVRTAFNQAFFSPQTKQYDQGTQFSNAFPLVLGMAEPADEPALVEHILRDIRRNQGHFDVGVLGAKYLIDALTEHGQAAAAYALATQTGYPSWAHLLEGGRTTLSEFWDLHGSHNHIMLGSIDGWFYRTLAGIQPDEQHPGFEHFFVRPFVPLSLGFVTAAIQTVRGPVALHWAETNGVFELTVSVPPDSTATIAVPARSPAAVRTRPLLALEHFEHGAASYHVGPGTYHFQSLAQ